MASKAAPQQKDKRRPAARASERLRRLLVLVPHVLQHPGAKLTELATLFGSSEGELLDDLNLLFMSGLPPYGPGDLIDVDVSDGRVWINMADYFGRPVRLTQSEALALYLKGKALLGAPGLEEAPALRSALEKLEDVLGKDMLEGLTGRVEVGSSGQGARTLAALRRAAQRHERVEIDYYTAARGELTTRRVDPEHVFSAIGHWYVVAWDSNRDEERLFRTDRIRAVRETGETFEPRGLAGAGRPLYTRTERDIPVKLFLGPRARWVTEYYETEDVRRHGDSLEVTLPAKDLPWLAKLVLRLGGEAVVTEPDELRDEVRRTAQDTLARYRSKA